MPWVSKEVPLARKDIPWASSASGRWNGSVLQYNCFLLIDSFVCGVIDANSH